MAKIHFYLKEPNSKESLILLHVFLHGNRVRMSTSERVLTKYWNEKSEMVRETKNYPDYFSINASLHQWLKAANMAIMTWEQKGRQPTRKQLRDSIKAKRFPERGKEGVSSRKLVILLEDFIDKEKAAKRLKRGTLQSYEQLLNNVKEKESPLKNLELDDLNLEALGGFISFLEADKAYARSNVHKLQKKLIRVLNWCQDIGIRFTTAYKRKSWRVKEPQKQSNEIALQKDEIQKLKDVQLVNAEDAVRDIFLVGVLTGQRLSDYKNFSRKNIVERGGAEYLEFNQKKTQKPISIKMPKEVGRILDKHDGKLPVFSDPHFNRQLKKIAKKAGLNREVILSRQYAEGVKEERTTVHEAIVSHTARRTFVTLAISRGISLDQLMTITGHSSLKTLTQYLKKGNTFDGNIDFIL